MTRHSNGHVGPSRASLLAAGLLACTLAHTNAAWAAVYRSRTVHRAGATRSRTVYRGPSAYGGSVRYSSRTVVRAPVVAPVRRTVHAAGHVVHRIGHVVTALPRGYTTVRYRSVTYYRHGSVYYRPYYQGSTLVYRIVAPPVATPY